jgi:steroid delta-isomerase-like uncharacterized protein
VKLLTKNILTKMEVSMKNFRQITRISFVIFVLLFCLFGCRQELKKQITEEDAKVLMDSYMKATSEADLVLLNKICAPEFVLRTPIAPEPIVGIEGYKNFVTNTSKTFPDFNITVDEVTVKGDSIWSHFTFTGTNTGPLGQLPATGKKIKISGLAITRVANGKVVEDETFWNVLQLYQQLGFTLSPPKEIAK